MRTYEADTPRAAFAAAAAALTALTLGAFVAMPAVFDSGFGPEMTLAVTAPAVAAPQEVAILPGRIDVVGVREPNVAWALGDPAQPCRPTT